MDGIKQMIEPNGRIIFSQFNIMRDSSYVSVPHVKWANGPVVYLSVDFIKELRKSNPSKLEGEIKIGPFRLQIIDCDKKKGICAATKKQSFINSAIDYLYQNTFFLRLVFLAVIPPRKIPYWIDIKKFHKLVWLIGKYWQKDKEIIAELNKWFADNRGETNA